MKAYALLALIGMFSLMALPSFAEPKPKLIVVASAASASIYQQRGAAKVIAAINAPATSLQTFTVADLQAALADAQAQSPPDTRHGQCWSALIPFVQGLNVNGVLPAGPGLAQLVQKGFDLQVQVAKPLFPDNVVTSCALVVSDLNTTFLKLAGRVGLVGVGVANPLSLPVL